MLTGIVFFVWNTCCKLLVKYKWDLTQYTIDLHGVYVGYIPYILVSLAFAAIAVLLTIKLYPLAAGGGTTEMIGYFNGVDYPGVFSKRLLLVKNISLMFAIAAGFCIGKEGVIA
jgi:H+/Cl- antiporter ClcA